MNKKIEMFLRKQLSTDDKWALKALITLYNRQTPNEKYAERTKEYNDKGFSSVDAEILTSFAKQLIEREFLSKKQMTILKLRISKYWRQIWEVSDKVKLSILVQKADIQMNLLEVSNG